MVRAGVIKLLFPPDRQGYNNWLPSKIGYKKNGNISMSTGRNFAVNCLKKNQIAPRTPSEHPPVRGEKMSKRLGRIKGCKYKTSSWHSNGFPDGNNILVQQNNIGEEPTAILSVHLH